MGGQREAGLYCVLAGGEAENNGGDGDLHASGFPHSDLPPPGGKAASKGGG